jgi:uncharacterized protein (TIGR03437 family)
MVHPAFLIRSFASSPARALILLTFATSAFAQLPLIYSRSVYNAASYIPAGIPAGAIAQGSVFTLFGANLGPTTGVSASSFPLSTTLAGVRINVAQGTNTVPAIPVYVSASQINAIMPSNAPVGADSMQVFVNNAASNFSPVRVTSTAFGIFTALGTGLGPGVLQNYVSQANQPINLPKLTAQPGQTITLWGTRLGPVPYGDNIAPTPGNLPVQVQVFVGGVPAQVAYSGRSPCCSGTDQIVFTVPANAPQGCWVPVYVKTAGSVVSNYVSMAIGPKSGGVCSNGVYDGASNVFLNGGSFGGAIVGRTITLEDIGVTSPVTVTADYHLSAAYQIPNVTFPFNPAITLPPYGTCTDYIETGDVSDAHPLPGSITAVTPLNLGAPFLLTGPNGIKTLTAAFNSPSQLPVRSGELGGSITNNILPSSLFLSPGSYNIMGFGGTGTGAVGAFSTNFTVSQPVNWTNQSTTVMVNRTQPLTLNWTGGNANDSDFIIGMGVDLPSNSSSIFVCSVPWGSNSFTVPADILANMPATRENPLHSKDVIYLMDLQGPSVVNLNASGLTAGTSAFYLILGKTVIFE